MVETIANLYKTNSTILLPIVSNGTGDKKHMSHIFLTIDMHVKCVKYLLSNIIPGTHMPNSDDIQNAHRLCMIIAWWYKIQKCTHFCSKVVYCGIWDMWIVGFVRLVYSFCITASLSRHWLNGFIPDCVYSNPSLASLGLVLMLHHCQSPK